MRRRLRAMVATAAIVLAVPAPAVAQPADPCAGWEMRTLASGLGLLENLEPDRRGGMLLSTERDRVERLLPDGTVEVAFEGLASPGGLRLRDGSLFVNTGNSLQSGLLGTADGTIQRIDLDTGESQTWAEGLVMPNGLVFDDAGRAFTSRDLGLDGAVTVVPADPPRTPRRFAEIRDTNGLAIDASGEWLYAATTFDPTAPINRVRLDDPTVVEPVASLALVGVPIVKGLDDMTFDAADILYVTANGTGEVLRVDPATGHACVIASGIGNPTAVKLGAGQGWEPDHLYVTAWDGTVRELVPPAGAEPTPFPQDATPAPEPAPDPNPAPEPAPELAPSPESAPGPAPSAPDPDGGALPATGTGAPGLVVALLALGAALALRSGSTARAPSAPGGPRSAPPVRPRRGHAPGVSPADGCR